MEASSNVSAAGANAEGDVANDVGMLVISVPPGSSARISLALRHCTIWEKKGSSFVVTCNICGFRGTVSVHKLLYGHYLGQKGNDVQRCVTGAMLESRYPEFYAEVMGKASTLENKRK